MPLFFLGTREWRNRQTRTVQVRVPVMEWGFNSPLAHDETADPLRICGFWFPACGRGVAVPVFLCCLWSPGRSWRRRPRPLCVPVGGGPPAFCLWPRQISGRRATCPPARLGVLTSFGTAPRSPPVPSGPSGALHTSGAGLRHGRRPARSPSAQIRPLARGRRWARRGRLRALRVRPLGCGSRGDLEGPRDAEVAPLAQEVIMPREGKRAEHVRQPLQLDYWSAITV